MPYSRATWRVLYSGAADGVTHMAMDEAIWESVAAGRVPPTLRLYAWQPPCLSLGRNQPLDDVDRVALEAAGYDLVRRPTGGRAILHTDELTYSVVVPLSDPRVQGGVLASCAALSVGLSHALELLEVGGVASHRRKDGPTPRDPVCFESTGNFEITVGGRKLIGSAQMRGQGALLQHGTLPLRGDIARICALLRPPADPLRVRARATTLEAALGRDVPWEEAAEAAAEGFSTALNLQLERGKLTAHEQAEVERLREEKYGAAEWTERT